MDLNARTSVHGAKKPSSRPGVFWLTLICFAIILIVILLIVVTVLASRLSPRCGQSTLAVDADNPQGTIFSSLSPAELEQARDYMLHKSGLGLVNIDNARPNDAYVFFIDLQLPNKADALNYLDHNGPKPDRVAKVFVTRGDKNPPIIEEYLVNLNNKTHVLYKNPSYSRDPIPHSSRPADVVEMGYMSELYKTELKKIEQLLIESYGARYTDCDKKKEACLIAIDVAPRGRKSGDRESWVYLLRDVEGYYLHPVGIQFLIVHKGSDSSQWRITKFFYNNEIFASVDELLNAYNSGKVAKVKLPFPKDDKLYSSFEHKGPPSGESKRPPTIVYPDGPRYTIQGNRVNYMNWQFDFRMNPSTGVKLFDVRFAGKRVVYEFGNVDAIVFYSGNDPMQGKVNFFDAAWFLGIFSFELAKGVDCPNVATYIDHPYFQNSNTVKKTRNAMCIFEHDMGVPLGRHYSADFVTGKGYREYAGMVDYALIVRYVPVIWNYDYIIDFIFHQDGVLEARISTSGYLQTTFYSPKEEKYSYKVEESVVGPMHSHVLNFKADIDIEGRNNRFETLNILVENKTHPWVPSDYKVQKYFEKQEFANEKDALLQYNFDQPKYYVVYNNDAKNKLGYNKGMRIKLMGMIKVLTPYRDSQPNPGNGAYSSQYQVAVTKHKDAEVSGTSIYSQNDPFDPVVDFAKFVEDNESIQDEDLVVWVTLGVHHIPSVEDVPVTSTSSNKGSLFLVPYNYHDVNNPMVNSLDLISLKPNDDFSDITVERNGVPYGVGCWQDFEKFSYNGTNFY